MNLRYTIIFLMLFIPAKLFAQPGPRYTEYDPCFNSSLLDERDLPASCFLKRAKFYLEIGQTARAFLNIDKAIEKNDGIITCETLYLRCDAYTQTYQYELALKAISAAINCQCYGYRGGSLDDRAIDYTTRIGLLIKLQQYDKALIDYDSLCSIYKGKPFEIRKKLERANFKINYLKDYTSAITDLKKTIDEMPDNLLCYELKSLHRLAYSYVYFSLATAEYLNGDSRSASRHWLQAVESGYITFPYDSTSLIIHFDSIINKNPTLSELYLARAIEYFLIDRFVGLRENFVNDSLREDFVNDCIIRALNDINKAEALGMNDYRINMYRALVLYELKKYNEAMKEINLAILKNNTYPRCFWIRYEIRKDLGQAESYDTDIDFIQFKKLAEDWTWERW